MSQTNLFVRHNTKRTGLAKTRVYTGGFQSGDGTTVIEKDGDCTLNTVICEDLTANGDTVVNNLTVMGNFSSTSNILVGEVPCDRKFKKNIHALERGVITLKKLKPKRYDHILMDETTDGLVAQDVETVIPSAVHERDGYDKDGKPSKYKTLSLLPLLSHTILAIQELIGRVEKIESLLHSRWNCEKGMNKLFSTRLKFHMDLVGTPPQQESSYI